MALIRNTASMQLRGRVGNTTYYSEGGRLIARVSQNSSNYGEGAARSERQQFQRGKWGNLVNFYKVSKAWMKKAFENRKANQSDYNRFMQLNTANGRVYLTKSMYAQGGCVVDAFRISEGSLRSISVFPVGSVFRTDLKLGDLTIGAATTVGDFSAALIENNNHIHNNMQISFISYQQEVNQFDVPQLICTAYEVTLDTESTELVRSYLPVFCSNGVDGYLGTNDNISIGAFAYVLSESVSGKTLVSTQELILNNSVLIAQYTSAEAIERSIKSYGVDTDVFLASGSNPTQATPQPLFISSVVNRHGDEYVYSENRIPLNGWLSGGEMKIYLSTPVPSVSNVVIKIAGSTYDLPATGGITLEGTLVTLPYSLIQTIGSSIQAPIDIITVVTSKGSVAKDFTGVTEVD